MADKSTYDDLRKLWKSDGMTIAKKWSNKFFADTIYQKLRGVAPGLFAGNGAAGAYKDKLFGGASGKDRILESLKTALKANEIILAQCEHNRWNVQQLLMEFSPCGKQEDELCRELNRKIKEYEREMSLHDNKSPEYEALKKKKNDVKYELKSLKNSLKESEDRIHPNICGYSHLDDVDSGAKEYDVSLNNAIADIIVFVDGYGK